MNDDRREQLFSNIVEAAAGVPERIQVRQHVHFYKDEPDYAGGLAGKLDLACASEHAAALADLSVTELIAKTSAEGYVEPQSTPEPSLAKAAG